MEIQNTTNNNTNKIIGILAKKGPILFPILLSTNNPRSVWDQCIFFKLLICFLLVSQAGVWWTCSCSPQNLTQCSILKTHMQWNSLAHRTPSNDVGNKKLCTRGIILITELKQRSNYTQCKCNLHQTKIIQNHHYNIHILILLT